MDVFILAAVAVGLVLLVLLVVLSVLQARQPRSEADERMARTTSMGMSLGMLFGAMLGVIVWASTGEFVFWVVFMGGGMVTGLALGRSWATRQS